MNSDCPFCKLPEETIIAQNKICIAYYDNHPVTQGHTLIITKCHIDNIFDLSSEEITACWQLIKEMREKLQKDYPEITGFNIGINVGLDAGQTITHAHWHLIPRRKGDIEDPAGGVRGVIPEKRIYK